MTRRYFEVESFETMYGCKECVLYSEDKCQAPYEITSEIYCGNSAAKALRINNCLTEDDIENGCY